MIITALILGYLMLVWYRTNAFVEYMQLFKLGRLFHIQDYEKLQSEGYDGVYSQFLREWYADMFIVRLLSCPVCLSFWLAVGVSLFSFGATGVAIAPLALFFYLALNKML